MRYQQNGRTSHLIGLRDFTDQTSLAQRIDSNGSALNVSSDKVSVSRPPPLLLQYNVLLLVDLRKRVVEASSFSASGLLGILDVRFKHACTLPGRIVAPTYAQSMCKSFLQLACMHRPT